MKRLFAPLIAPAAFLALLMASCGEGTKQGRCDVEVFISAPQYTEAKLYALNGSVLDSTLTVARDSVRFTRTDSLQMPYVANLQLRNPSDSIDFIVMPVVVEKGTVCLDLSDRISLGGTPDNEKLFRFQKEKNSFMAKYDAEENPKHDLEKMKTDYSKFFADQAILYKGSVVGDYILEVYGPFISREDMARAKERMITN